MRLQEARQEDRCDQSLLENARELACSTSLADLFMSEANAEHDNLALLQPATSVDTWTKRNKQ